LLVLSAVLRRHAIRSVVNVGARVDFYSAYLSRRFPNINFVSLDFQPELEQHNSLLRRALNWRFKSGYPLEVIRNGEADADLYFSVSTSVLMNNVELNMYLDAVCSRAKVVAFCEGWWPRTDTLSFRIWRPEDIPKEQPFCAGDYANYHHNYIAKLYERGFEIELSRIVVESARYHYLQIVARRAE
jgi:hypothetical protein